MYVMYKTYPDFELELKSEASIKSRFHLQLAIKPKAEHALCRHGKCSFNV